ncbi:type II toxin-antitoxin system VapC family toxin [Phytoactinopolyspora alkaliphila]|uniref:Type II toxin-antitoxin system VapC family toxin n=1 Tax=Phytoactinopolyspora alkaliphila TaxID=1783498 RepID=A0A6N9YLT4_9ACTN|nr:type II toxin-antitoxin system VapC family toxin [Phytoactinopolyspora alkaliphila]
MTVGTVLLDTNVFTAWLRPQSPLLRLYGRHVYGRRIAVAQQTVAEARYGAIAAGWGDKRREQLERLIRRSRPLPVDDETVWSYARLRAECRRLGHPLHQKGHLGDLWIAATAIRWDVPLVAHDAIFLGCPGVELRTELQH